MLENGTKYQLRIQIPHLYGPSAVIYIIHALTNFAANLKVQTPDPFNCSGS